MPTPQSFTVTLPEDVAKLMLAQLNSGDYHSESEVVSAGLRALAERDMAQDQWLRGEVLPAYEAYKADKSKPVPAREVFDSLEARYHKRKAAQAH